GRQAHRITIRPAAAGVARSRRPLFFRGSRAGVLHVDEHGLLIRRGDHPGDFLADGPGQEAAHLAGYRVGAEHGVVAEYSELIFVLAAFPNIGLDPHAAVLVDPQAIRRAEQVVCSQRLTHAVHFDPLTFQVGLATGTV